VFSACQSISHHSHSADTCFLSAVLCSGYCSCVGGILWKTAAEVCKGISEENTDEETLGIQAGETQMQ